MFTEKIKMVAPCLLGMEGALSDELKNMGAENVLANDGRVYFEGGFDILARANLSSRFGERVQIFMGSFTAVTFDELFEKVKALPWETYIGKKDAFPVKGHCLNSKLFSVSDCQAIIKKAVVERLKAKYRIDWFEESMSKMQIQFLIMKDNVSVMIDTSGAGLHKRGYRENANEAPIKETLAAGMAYYSRLRRDANMYDPLCGSGTILIESALYAMNIAPGLKRRFEAEKWNSVPQNVWKTERGRALDLIKRDVEFKAYGSDISREAVELTIENAKKAGVLSRITVSQRDISDFETSTEFGCVICNPPYGERLLDIKSAQSIYKTMGNVFMPKHGYNYSIISHDDEFEHYFGRKADKRRKLYNGNLKCQLYMYFKY